LKRKKEYLGERADRNLVAILVKSVGCPWRTQRRADARRGRLLLSVEEKKSARKMEEAGRRKLSFSNRRIGKREGGISGTTNELCVR